MHLCVEQAGTAHVVYEIEEPAWGGIGALTEVDLNYAQAHAGRLLAEARLRPGPFTILLQGEDGTPLDQRGSELEAKANQPVVI